MPISKEQALQIVQRLSQGESPEALTKRLAPVPERERALPTEVPGPRETTADARARRLELLHARGVDVPNLSGDAADPDPETLTGKIEQYVGMTRVPTGLIGPLRVNGLHAHGDFYVPIATTEGALVASYHRGARLVTEAGGVSCLVTAEQVQRAPAFLFDSIAEAAHFAAWATQEFDVFRSIAATRTSHGSLIDLQVQLQSRSVYLILAYYTADAAGQNMVTFCTQAICEDILRRAPVKPRSWFLESNMSGDKKATVLSFLNTRGRRVMAEVKLPRRLVEDVLHTTPERMCEYWRLSFIGGVQSGSIGVSGHIANGLAGIFLATGQDVACVSEASVGVTVMELTADGGLYSSLDLPNLIVGTVGGGTSMPTAAECLRILECEGAGNAAKLAEIVAAALLGGELSIVGALCSGHFARAHERLGRRPPA